MATGGVPQGADADYAIACDDAQRNISKTEMDEVASNFGRLVVASSQNKEGTASGPTDEGGKHAQDGGNKKAQARSRNLASAASSFARRLAGTSQLYDRLRGFVAHGHLRPSFCAAVCYHLDSKIDKTALRRSGANSVEADILLHNIWLWGEKADRGREKPSKKDIGTDTELVRAVANTT